MGSALRLSREITEERIELAASDLAATSYGAPDESISPLLHDEEMRDWNFVFEAVIMPPIHTKYNIVFPAHSL